MCYGVEMYLQLYQKTQWLMCYGVEMYLLKEASLNYFSDLFG